MVTRSIIYCTLVTCRTCIDVQHEDLVELWYEEQVTVRPPRALQVHAAVPGRRVHLPLQVGELGLQVLQGHRVPLRKEFEADEEQRDLLIRIAW
jgi:hypothetical protein